MDKERICIKGKDYPFYKLQTIIIGSGAAGLNAAVSLYKEGQEDIAIVTEGQKKGTSRNTGSDKQTYYKITTCGSEPDSIRQMAQTLYNGESMDGDIALAEAALSMRSFYHLVDIGVPFPYNSAGEYVGYKTDHDPNQRGTSAGPLTSKYMTEMLWKEVERLNIRVFDGYQVIELLVNSIDEQQRVCGALAIGKDNNGNEEYIIFSTENIIYATGGEAGMYDTSVYPISQVGGMGLALRAGVIGKNLTESQYGIASTKFRWNLSGTFQQVIPRYVSTKADGSDEQEFLNQYFESIKDMLHAIFLKGYQWPFDPRKVGNNGSSLIDILVYQETVQKGRRVFLDFRKNPSCAETEIGFDFSLLEVEAYEYLKNSNGLQDTPIKRLQQMNSAAIELYLNNGIDIQQELLEIAVCAQHNNGGLSGNCWWESNIKHFFPVGEVNGSHGVYRPGGSALNSGQVGGLRAAQYIAAKYNDSPLTTERFKKVCKEQILEAISFGTQAMERKELIIDIAEERKLLGLRMTRFAAHIRSLQGVQQAIAENKKQIKRIMTAGIGRSKDLVKYYRLRDLLISQQVYLHAIENYILKGGKSRGSYLIEDKEGEKPMSMLSDEFRFLFDDSKFSDQIQEVQYQNQEIVITWRAKRTIPEEDNWFESVWKRYREKAIF